MSSNPPVNFVDDPQAPETFVSGISGVFHVNGIVSVTLESHRVDHSTAPGPVNRVVVQRLVMPVSAAQALVVGLNDFLDKQGLSPSSAVKGEQTTQ